MRKTKKIIISMIIAFLGVIGICASSNAYDVGQWLDVTYSDYVNNGNIFCVEHGQALKSANTYHVVSKVNIEGIKSTDYDGKTIESWYNAKLAYILSSNDTSAVKNAIWNNMYTWMNQVGKNHNGLYQGFANSSKGKNTYLDEESSEYANNIQNVQNIVDNTNKDNIQVVPYEKDGKSYVRVGPFNWTFPGTMKDVEVKDQNGNKIDNILYSNFKGGDERWFDASDITSGKNFYVSIPAGTDVTKITTLTGTSTTTIKGVTIWFLEAKHGDRQNLIIREPYGAPLDISTPFDYDIDIEGNLKVIKVNEDNEQVKLKGVKFIFQHQNTGKYLAKDQEGKVTYVDNRQNASEWVTDENGEISIEKISAGTYIAYETYNPNYGYEEQPEPTQAVVKAGEQVSVVIIGNKQIYVKLSGFVWKDVPDSKTTDGNDRNSLFAEGDETRDVLFDGIVVRLKDRTTGETVKETKTAQLPDSGRYKDERGHDGHGEYLFEDVLIEKLGDYYIEFEYDGLTYTNVVPHLDKNNGSKASESEERRTEFNNNFSKIEGKTRNTGVTIDANGNEKHNLSYNIDETKHEATLINNGQYTITADTDVTGYNVRDHFTYGQEEIKHINLGLYDREQPDIGIAKDIKNVRLTINGYEHTYQYSQRFSNQGEYEDGLFNVGVKFGLPTKPYTAAIYKSDYDYENEKDRSKELQTYITYQIAITNKSENLQAKVNSLVDYYDARYSVVDVGTNLDEKGNITNSVGYSEDETFQNSKFKKMIIDTNTTIDPLQKNGKLYVQFKLSREAVAEILEDEAISDDTIKLLDNVVEVNSYSIYQDGKIYAGIDKNSAPANAVPGNEPTYEDDTDKAPALKLEVANPRVMSGVVFLDETSAELKTGEIREGNGIYETDKEKGIGDVAVTLKENSGSGKEYKVTTDGSGKFEISNYIPGDYTLTYTWGDSTYTVQNYKGTIYINPERQNNRNWHKENVDTRYSDALDNYETRQKIDEEMKNVNKDTKNSFTIHKMDSTTPTMGITIENVKNVADKITTSSYGDELKYRIDNLDFGIVERARQNLELIKRVKTLKLTLANGQVISDVTVNEDGTLSGNSNNITYMKPDPNNNPKNGYIKLEIDNEMLQGSKLEVGYSIKAINQGELDYISEDYYKYGSQVKESNRGQKVTVIPSGIIDYLDKDWSVDKDANPDWQLKTLDEAKDLVAETVYNNEESTIDEKTILYTDVLSTPLEPKQSSEVMLKVSKLLSVTDEISLNNETEIVKATKNGGSNIITMLGNYIPGVDIHESDDSIAETTMVTPSTGENQNYIIPITLGISTLIILGSGIIIIKRKVLDKNN